MNGGEEEGRASVNKKKVLSCSKKLMYLWSLSKASLRVGDSQLMYA